jgi:hypothetical protein
MAKFTLILEFCGGTYIRQIKAPSPKTALRKLAAGADDKKDLFLALVDEGPVAIQGISKCWCSSATYRGKLALVNIVKTAE